MGFMFNIWFFIVIKGCMCGVSVVIVDLDFVCLNIFFYMVGEVLVMSLNICVEVVFGIVS